MWVELIAALPGETTMRPPAVGSAILRPTNGVEGEYGLGLVLVVGLGLFLDYLEHGRTFPNRRANAGPDQTAMDSRSSSGRCVPSRHQAEGHPQVLIIAPGVDRLAKPRRTVDRCGHRAPE
ncbi:hypothetical protein [Actinopolymorpha pittospori]|uniref:Uncharacterized protein n=1 Tax=Actinopolymorpha pittospori TaxID=648752 RepID=A0A927R9N8_9ACTN|nr:hypothetical protein [Actinopolymorpha pittospori]MBE1608042.1 hypothetical protein [Actinopolymorpha pittospori]